MKQAKWLYLGIILWVAGCASTSSNKAPPVDINSELLHGIEVNTSAQQRNTEIKLAEAAVSVAHSLQTLASIEKATHPKASLHVDQNPYHIGMGQISSIDWTGPIEPVVKKIAEITHYRMHILGSQPAIPVIVSINDQNVPIGQILRNIGFQVQKQADVVVLPKKHIIEIRYQHL